MPYINIFDLLLFLSANLFNNTFLYISIYLAFFNSKILASVINKFSFIIIDLFITKVIIIHPTTMKFETPFKFKRVFNKMQKESQLLKYHPKWLILFIIIL